MTLGEEGFFLHDTPYARYNPFGTPSNVLPGWSGRVGQARCANCTVLLFKIVHFSGLSKEPSAADVSNTLVLHHCHVPRSKPAERPRCCLDAACHVRQDFVSQHSSPNLDYAAIHLWPDNWGTTGALCNPSAVQHTRLVFRDAGAVRHAPG